MRSIFFFLPTLMLLGSCSLEKKATKAFNVGKYQTAIELNKKILEKNPNNGKANYFIGESYRLSNRLKEAEAYYAKAGGRGFDKDSIQFYHAQSLKADGKYTEARKEYEALADATDNNALKDRARAEMNGLEYLSKLAEKQSYYKVKNLEPINTPASEYSPVYLNSELYFTSSRGDGKIYEAEGKPFTDLYKVATKGANVEVNTITKLPEGINEDVRNEGCVTFSPDGKTMVFAKGNSEKKKGGGVDVDLYISRFRNNVWSEPIPININTVIKVKPMPMPGTTAGTLRPRSLRMAARCTLPPTEKGDMAEPISTPRRWIPADDSRGSGTWALRSIPPEMKCFPMWPKM